MSLTVSPVDWNAVGVGWGGEPGMRRFRLWPCLHCILAEVVSSALLRARAFVNLAQRLQPLANTESQCSLLQ